MKKRRKINQEKQRKKERNLQINHIYGSEKHSSEQITNLDLLSESVRDYVSCIEVTNVLGSDNKQKKLEQIKNYKIFLEEMLNPGREYNLRTGLCVLHSDINLDSIKRDVDFYVKFNKYSEDRLEHVLIDINSSRIIVPESINHYDILCSHLQQGALKTYVSKMNTEGKLLLLKLLSIQDTYKTEIPLSKLLDSKVKEDTLLYNGKTIVQLINETLSEKQKRILGDKITDKISEIRGLTLEVYSLWAFNKYLDHKLINQREYFDIHEKLKRFPYSLPNAIEIDLFVSSNHLKEGLLRMKEEEPNAEVYISPNF